MLMCSSCVQAGTRYSGKKERDECERGSRAVSDRRCEWLSDGGRSVKQDERCRSSAVAVWGKLCPHAKTKTKVQTTIHILPHDLMSFNPKTPCGGRLTWKTTVRNVSVICASRRSEPSPCKENTAPKRLLACLTRCQADLFWHEQPVLLNDTLSGLNVLSTFL